MKKRIIILCDGTWNDLEMRYITNVGRLAQILEPVGKSRGRKIPQVLFYDDGVAATDSGLTRMVNGALGGGLERNIYEAYRFLVFNYQEGDEVCLFGFSRGAYTVRSLAGMIGRVGLAPKTEMKYISEALAAYRGKPADQEAFRTKVGSQDLDIMLLGCWDTVGARGIPDKIPWLSIDEILREKYRFHDTDLGGNVLNALHAVAMHERRKEFDVTLMNRLDNGKQTLKQVWFPGDHGCIGGGRWEKRGLSNRCLRWMLEEAKDLGVDLGIKWNRLKDHDLADHNIFFDNTVGFPYDDKARRLPKDPGAFDWTAIRRYQELPSEQKGWLKRYLSEAGVPLQGGEIRQPMTGQAALAEGDVTHVVVESQARNKSSGIQVESGQRFRFTIGRAQVWKDGDLDPCDIMGWNVEPPEKENSKIPWKDGRPMDTNLLSKHLIRMGRNKRLADDADWFELVVGLDGEAFDRLTFNRPARADTPYSAEYTAQSDGELHFAANDLKWGLIDKFGNNRGWVWVTVERIR